LLSLIDIKSAFNEQPRRLGESVNKLESTVLEHDRLINSQYSRIQAHVADALTDVAIKASDSEKRLRDELSQKIALLERVNTQNALQFSPW
jgi:hypothetical protein